MGKKRILIIGDTIIDHDVFLEASGLSLESPTLKTKFNKDTYKFGGASNVARYAREFGAQVTFITSLTKRMAEKYVLESQVHLLNVVSNLDTVKTRNYIYKGDNQYNYLQINRVNNTSCPTSFVKDLDFGKFDIVAISDYRCGLFSPNLVKKIRQNTKILFAASQLSDKKPNYDQYTEADYLVCNEAESLHIKDLTNVFVTLGEKGCSFNGKQYLGKSVKAKQTIGAGDVFYAALLVTGSPVIANDMSSKYVAGEIL